MSEKEEEDIDAKRMEIVQALSELGENKIAKELFKKVEKKMTFAEREDWVNEQICSVFPNNIDVRCIAFCCSPRSACPYRAAVLRKVGWKMEDYVNLKAEFGEQIKRMIENKK